MMSVDEVGEVTPKQRVASQHKKHLVQASKFIFDSPAGRLKETVKDVERFQQCIEDISKAIRARDRSVWTGTFTIRRRQFTPGVGPTSG